MDLPSTPGAEDVALVLVSPRKAELPATAAWHVVPAWRRGGIAGALLLLGAVLAVPAVAVPPHGVVSVVVFGVAALGAYAAWSRSEFVADVRFRCSCGADAHVAEVGQWTPDTWIRCPSCAAPWRIAPRR